MGLNASPEASPSQTQAATPPLRVHVRLRGKDHEGFGLHVWGPAASLGTEWSTPLLPCGEDWYGLIFEVPLAGPSTTQTSTPALGLILHRGEDKRACLEFSTLGEVPAAGESIWFGHAAGFLKTEPSQACIPSGDLDSLGARAHWLTPELIAWRAAGQAPEGSSFTLHSSATAALKDAGDAGVVGCDADSGPYALTLVGKELTPELAQSHPYLRGCCLLQVPSSADPRRLCRTQLATVIQAPDGLVLDCTGVQVGALLDELFPCAAPLGCQPFGDEGGLLLTLWAPTALSVAVELYDSATGPVAETLLMTKRLGTEDDGAWRLPGSKSWWGRYYAYVIEAYHPASGQIATMRTPDPYSSACAADAARTLAVHLPTCDLAAPGGDVAAWRARPRPPNLQLPPRAGASVYELHVRDFSMSDPGVPSELKGKYLAFELEGTAGDVHLRRLAAAGLSHVQLLPTYDFGSVPERAQDRREQQIPDGAAPDSEGPQAAATAVADSDSFNWGYDPVLYNAPEGSYATDPDGVTRVQEHRRMIDALHAKGLGVVLDVVYNHTHSSGPEASRSVLDKCVPGYYHRRSEAGTYENSTCMNNTAGERRMMERLIVESVVHWATQFRVDGFRFDLMGHIPLQCICRCRAALDGLTLESDGVDGPRVLLHGEGWEFGEIQDGQRGIVSVQRKLAGTGIGSFNDRVRDATLGGSPFTDLRVQGFATGLAMRPWPAEAGVPQGDLEVQTRDLVVSMDKIRTALAAGLKEYRLAEDSDGNTNIAAGEVHGGGVAYTSAPVEMLNYVSAHDNETLYDNTVWKMPSSLFTPHERMRANWLCTSVVALAHGVPFFHAGDELLRSKSLDRDSYNSGDWFNVLDFTGQRSAFGTGLPPHAKNGDKWEQMRPMLRDPALRPNAEMVAASIAKFCELLRLRASTPLIGLLEAGDVLEKVSFPGCGAAQLPGVIVMQIVNGPPAGGPPDAPALCRRLARVVLVFSGRLETTRLPVPPSSVKPSLPLRLHPLQAASEDSIIRTAQLDSETDELVVPAQTAAVFVEPLPGEEGWNGM